MQSVVRFALHPSISHPIIYNSINLTSQARATPALGAGPRPPVAFPLVVVLTRSGRLRVYLANALANAFLQLNF
jgi:hypothetical protein